MDCFKTWLAFLSAQIVDQCIEHCAKDCPGCRDGLFAPLLHRHNQLNLHGKIDHYFERVTEQMDISSLFDQFIIRFGWFSLQRDEHVNIGENFIKLSTSDAIFFGNYITHENDAALYASYDAEAESTKHEKKSIKTKRRKKNIISQNDLLGGGATDC